MLLSPFGLDLSSTVMHLAVECLIKLPQTPLEGLPFYSGIKSVLYQNGALSFQKIPVGIGFNVRMYLSPHRRIYNRIG